MQIDDPALSRIVLELTGKLSAAEFSEARDLFEERPQMKRILYRPSNIGLALILLTGLCYSIWYRDWYVLSMSVVACLSGVLLITLHLRRQEHINDLNGINATLPDVVVLRARGVEFRTLDGALLFEPWTRFARLRWGKQVILVYKNGAIYPDVVLPLDALNSSEQSIIHDLLNSVISDSKPRKPKRWLR